MTAGVGVALATYNGEAFLRPFLDSLVAQTLPVAELVAADDGSTDGTVAILDGYADRLDIRLIRGERRGVIGNFERALAATRADYVATADQDDVWHADKLAVLASRMRQIEAETGAATPLLVFSDLDIVDQELRPKSRYFAASYKSASARLLSDFLISNHVPGCAMLMNRALIERALPIPAGANMHDWWLVMVAAAFGTIDHVPRSLVSYRQHGLNSVGAPDLAPRRSRAQRLRAVILSSRRAYRGWLDGADPQAARVRDQLQAFAHRYRADLPPRDRRALDAFLDPRRMPARLSLLARAQRGESVLKSLALALRI